MNWAQEFIEIFLKYSPSGLLLPKLHTWYYYIIPAIREFRSINSMTMETYETLHKYYVKQPYKILNKREKPKTKKLFPTINYTKLLLKLLRENRLLHNILLRQLPLDS